MKDIRNSQLFGPGDKNLYNIGAPWMAEKSERITLPYFKETYEFLFDDHVCLKLPPKGNDLERWIIKMVRSVGYSDLEEALKFIPLPPDKLLALPGSDDHLPGYIPIEETLRAVLILAKTNLHCYLPWGMPLFTRSRLGRNLRLIKINLDQFYEVD